MSTVVITLERGFSDHHVVIRVDGEKVLDEANVTTDAGSGIAGSVAADTGPRCHVEVALPDSGSSADLDLGVGELTYLQISLSENTLILTPVVESLGHI